MSVMVTGCSSYHRVHVFQTPNSNTFVSNTPPPRVLASNITAPGSPARGSPAPGSTRRRTPTPGSHASKTSTRKTAARWRLLVIRLSLSATALVLTTVTVFVQVHHAGVYQWPRQTPHTPHQHSLLASLSKAFNLRGVWVVTASSIVGTLAALVAFAFSFSPYHQVSDDSTFLNQVSILSSGWVYDPSPPPRPRAPETHVEAKTEMHRLRTHDQTSEDKENADPSLILTVSHSRHHTHDITSDSLHSVDSYGEAESPRLPVFSENVANMSVSDNGVDVTRHLPMVRLLSFAPRTSSSGYISNKLESSENNTQLLQLNQTGSRPSSPALRMGANDTPVIREQYLRSISPIRRVIMPTLTASQSSESPNPLSNLTYSTPAETSSSCRLSIPNNTLFEQYSQSQTVPYFSTDFRETFPHGMSVSGSSWSENVHVIYHGVQEALHSLYHDPLSEDTIAIPQKGSDLRVAALTNESSPKTKSVSFTREQRESNIRPKHKSSQSVSEVVILTRHHNSGLSQTSPLGNKDKASPPTPAREAYMCHDQTWRGICPTSSCGKPTPPIRSCTTRITSTLYTGDLRIPSVPHC
nr:uncharacterized protein LOC123773419 isoform X2 [Procambarus clarkii]